MDYDSEKGAMKTQKNTLSARVLIKDFVFSQTPDRIIRSIYRWKNVGRKYRQSRSAQILMNSLMRQKHCMVFRYSLIFR